MRPATILFAFLAASIPAARGDVIYSTIGPGITADTGGFFVSGSSDPQTVGYQFTPTTGGAAGLYELWFGSAGGWAGGTVRISLYADSGGSPNLGALLDTVTFSVGPNLATALYAVSSGINPILGAGTPYWIVASMVESNGRTYWANVSPQSNALLAYFNFGAGGSFVGDPGQYPNAAFRISTAAIAPEPGSLALAAVGGAGLILAARRRRGS